MCLPADGASQHSGRAAAAAAAATTTAQQPIPVVPFMVQGSLISTGSCTYFMDTSQPEEEEEEEVAGRGYKGVLTQWEADDELHLFLLWIIWSRAGRGVMSPEGGRLIGRTMVARTCTDMKPLPAKEE